MEPILTSKRARHNNGDSKTNQSKTGDKKPRSKNKESPKTSSVRSIQEQKGQILTKHTYLSTTGDKRRNRERQSETKEIKKAKMENGLRKIERR